MLALLVFLSVVACQAQSLGFGVKGGVPITSQVEGYATDESRRYVVGPMVEVALPHGLGFEADALYSRFGYSTNFGNFAGYTAIGVRANSWEFPFLAKYRFHLPLGRPYAIAGYSPRRVSGTENASGYVVHIDTGSRTDFSNSSATGYATVHGLVAGGGIELSVGRVRIAPETRYIHWNRSVFYDSGPQGYFVTTPQDQVEFLLGLTWR